MTASNELEIAIKNTQEILSKIITKPKCTNKLLNKPPFRFIHDIVTSTLKATGFPDGYFTTQELDSNHFNNKSLKVAFLEKLIYLVSVAKGIPLDVRPAKIVAGLEPLNTNTLLFAFGTVAIDETVPKDMLIEYCKNGGKIGHMDKDQQNVVLVEESKAGNRGRMVDDNKPQEITTSQKHINQDQLEEDKLDIPLTQTILHDLISKPKCTEKLLRKPPFRFIHDVVMAVNKASTIGLEKILSENEMDPNKVRDKEAKLEFLSKVVTVVENYLGIVIDIKPSKVVAGLEADKTRFFFQALVKAAKCSNPANFNIGPMNDRKLIQGNFENNVAGPMHSHPTKLDSNAEVTKFQEVAVSSLDDILMKGTNHKGGKRSSNTCGEEDVFSSAKNHDGPCLDTKDTSKEIMKLVHDKEEKNHHGADLSRFHPTSPSTTNTEKLNKAKQEITDDKNGTSNPTFPELSNTIADDNHHIEEITQRKELINARPKTAAARRISLPAKDEDIDDLVNTSNIYHARPFSLCSHKQHSSKQNYFKRNDACSGAGTMIKSKIKQDEESTVTQHLIRPGNLGMLQRSRSGDQDSTHSAMVTIQTTEYNTHAISESIQNIAKFVSPIVRLVEHFPEHTEKISLEHHRWLEQYQVLYHDFVAAKKRTKEALYPLETEISHIDNEILRFQQLITQATIQIRQNDKWIRYRRCNKPTA